MGHESPPSFIQNGEKRACEVPEAIEILLLRRHQNTQIGILPVGLYDIT